MVTRKAPIARRKIRGAEGKLHAHELMLYEMTLTAVHAGCSALSDAPNRRISTNVDSANKKRR